MPCYVLVALIELGDSPSVSGFITSDSLLFHNLNVNLFMKENCNPRDLEELFYDKFRYHTFSMIKKGIVDRCHEFAFFIIFVQITEEINKFVLKWCLLEYSVII